MNLRERDNGRRDKETDDECQKAENADEYRQKRKKKQLPFIALGHARAFFERDDRAHLVFDDEIRREGKHERNNDTRHDEKNEAGHNRKKPQPKNQKSCQAAC